MLYVVNMANANTMRDMFYITWNIVEAKKNNNVVSLSDVVYRDTVDKVKNAKQKKQVISQVIIAC